MGQNDRNDQGDHKDRPYGTAPDSLGRIIQAFKSLTTNTYTRGVEQDGWSPFPGRHIPLWCELASLLRVKDVLYENPMTMRRSALVAQFDGAEDTGKGPRGTYVSIDQTPFHVPMAFADHPSRGARARQVLKLLGDTERERKRIAMENAKVRTGLWGPRRHVDRAPPPPRLHADDGEHPCCPRLPSAAHSGSRAFRGARGRGRR